MTLIVGTLLPHSPLIAFSVIICIGTGYIIYQRCFHPLAKYPGPALASLSGLWRAYHIYCLDLHEKILQAHRRHGPIVRIGPNHLHFWNAQAVAPIYKSGRKMPKTDFYDAFTAFRPNLFGGRDEDIHSSRRRQLSHGFSQASIQKMESIIEIQIEILIKKLQRFAKTHEIFDLKEVISFYVLDILGEVAFGRPFEAQSADTVPEINAINDHLLLAGIIGSLPCQGLLKAAANWSPVPWMRRLIQSRAKLKQTCSDCVESKRSMQGESRLDMMQHLLSATDPKTGMKLNDDEIKSEAFAMLVAGSHSTAGTTVLLFWHLLHNPKTLAKVEQEIKDVLGDLPEDKIAYPIAGLEASLDYTRSCVQENFRITPVFNMCLWRSTHVAISNHALHHNPDIWGIDDEAFVPDRFMGLEGKAMLQSLIPFSIGHRMCIGRNLGLTNLWKTVTTLLNRFDFETISPDRPVRVESSGIGELRGSFLCRVALKKGE
ncbi:cytochrome P450 [Aaosphaeria arxii CBS 175.79]|uniref:Cytochrome P450 n=1 Tax=Aaosphaeria arxii CBS 175.79 TaxID=1450172 RepID=A0A6A5Y5B8_9PLEO|nr:cytochrome P450 [Aaosphaeria arxii CBS 175.79]KAF2020413.1 cytochrome P450 [Aaosphaeria arxii CBS 175.79]